MAPAAASPALIGFLRADRDGLNGRFAHARRRLPALDGEAFSAFLLDALGPLLDRVAALRAGRGDDTHDVGHAAYDVALELVGQRLAGPAARDPRVGDGWRAVVVAAAERVVEAPPRVLVAVANALAHLASTPGARPDEWAARMIEIAPVAGTLDAWLEAGQVLAWRCGLAHLREGALALCERVAPSLGPSLVGAPAGADWEAVRARLAADPWYAPSPSRRGVTGSGLRVVGRVGGFRGYGGLFVAPPVASRGGPDRFLIQSGDDAWVLFADAGGATFHRATDEERAEARRGPASAPAAPIVRDGQLEHRGRSVALPVRGRVTSVAASGTTAAVTCSQTHAIALVALADDGPG